MLAAPGISSGLGLRYFLPGGRYAQFGLPGQQFDTVISGCDVLNYLTSEDDLLAAFRTVHKLLAPGGLWLFDLNSDYKLREIYGNESYADLQDDFGYFWDNAYDEAEDICTMDLTFFVQVGENLYERRTERHRQKLWTPQEIGACLANRFPCWRAMIKLRLLWKTARNGSSSSKI